MRPTDASGMLAALAGAAAFGAVVCRRRSGPIRRLGRGVDRRSGRLALARVGSTPWLASRVAPEVATRLDVLGRSGQLSAVIGSKSLIGVSLAGLALVAPMPGPILGPVLALVGWRIPDVLLARRVRTHRARVDAEVPYLLDLLAAASTAGLSAPLALEHAAVSLRGPLASELARSLRHVGFGARWRDELRRLADRLDLPDVARAVSTLARSEALGISLADPVARLAAQVRAARRAAAAERARKAPVKMLFPLVFLILPAFLLLTVVPVFVSTVRSI